MVKEYRGQKVIAEYSAKLVPPNHNYPDCVCSIILTNQHLYVLEDNFDGTYETHFDFVVREIDDIGIERVGNEKRSGGQGQNALLLRQVITAGVYVMTGAISISGRMRKKMVIREYFVINYHDIQGEKRRLYFNINCDGAKKFIKAFHKVKEQ